jgi:heptosyltransferase-1
MSAILVVRPSSLGDVVYALALVSDVRTARPEFAIDWVAEEAFVPLVALHRGIRRVIPVALRRWRRSPWAAATWREAAQFRREVQRDEYRAVLDLQEQVKGALMARLARGVRHGPDRHSIREPVATLAHDVHHRIAREQHFVERCRQLAAAALGYACSGPPRFDFALPVLPAGAPAPPYAVLVHATSRAEKLWPEPHWRSLIATLASRGLRVLLPWGSDAERDRAERLAAGTPGAQALPRLALDALAGVLARAALVAGVDTGLVHLAAALGTPTLSLFVATDPRLAGVGRTGAHARDLGGVGCVPTPDDVLAAAGGVAAIGARARTGGPSPDAARDPRPGS